jgi:signal peptidase I
MQEQQGETSSAIFVEVMDRYAARSAARRVAAGRGRRRTVREGAQTLALALLIFLGTHSAVQGRAVEGPSMQPTYHDGQRLFINRAVYARIDLDHLSRLLPLVDVGSGTRYLFHAPRRGEVVVFDPPFAGGDDLIKRVIGVPGDRVQVRDGRVFVNGRALAEPYLLGTDTPCAGRWCDVTLGPDEYFVMGDNRINSSESRFFGPVKGHAIIGKAWLVVHPFSEFGPAR